MSPTLNQDTGFGDRQFMVITSEKQCRIVALPSQNCVHRLQITETDFVVRAEVISMKGEHSLLSLSLSNIQIQKALKADVSLKRERNERHLIFSIKMSKGKPDWGIRMRIRKIVHILVS
jgi:hypothetical protein